jgi:AcrR family transcriptional regulator
MSTESSHARQQILETASELFYYKGIQHVGINEVIAASGVAKRTLYRWFPSKDLLIEAVMNYRAAQWIRWFGPPYLSVIILPRTVIVYLRRAARMVRES